MQAASAIENRAHKPGPPSHHVLGAYYPSWKIYSGDKPSHLRLDLLTHVYYAFARIDADGNVIHLDNRADEEILVDDSRGCLEALTMLKRVKHPHLRILLSIGGGSGSQNFPAVASDKVKLERFCRSTCMFVVRFGLDGVDVDWEHPKSEAEGAGFVCLLEVLRRYLRSPRYTITAALPAGEWCLKNIDLPRLLSVPAEGSMSMCSTLDYMNVMCYDFAGPWTNGQSGHHAQLRTPEVPHNAFAKRSIAAVTKYLTRSRRIDPQKIVLGIPAYGRHFHGVDGPGQSLGRGDGAGDGTVEYRNIQVDAEKEDVDRELGAAGCCPESGGWISYDSPETVRMKVDFVREWGLAGVLFWTGSYDAAKEGRSLVVAAAKGLCLQP